MKKIANGVFKNKMLSESAKQFLLYLLVGGGATIVEWIAFSLFRYNGFLQMDYFLATSLAFILSTFANWLLGRIIMFKATLARGSQPY